jgi:hypothetical protein
MANIRLKELVEANVDPKLVARSKETGKLVYFKNAQNKDAAMKAGTHSDPKAEKGGEPKSAVKPNDMFGGDYKKDRGAEAPKSEPTPKINSKNWTPDEDDGMSNEASDDVQNYLNNVLGADGSAEVDYNTGNIQYGLADSENSIFVGYADDKYNVSFEGPSMDIDKINQSYKSFKNPKEALQYAGELAKANRKELGQKQEPSSKLTSMLPKDTTDGPKINGKDQSTPNRQFDKKKPFDPKEIEKDVTDMLQSDGYEVEHQWGTNDYFLNISKKDKKGKEIERYTVQKDPKTGMADVWDAVAKTWVVEGEPNIDRLYDTIGQIPYFRED